MKLFISIVLMFAGMCLHAGEYYIPKVEQSVKPRMEVVQTEQRNGYECQYVEFDVEKGERISAYLLVPDGHHCGKDVQKTIAAFLDCNLG